MGQSPKYFLFYSVCLFIFTWFLFCSVTLIDCRAPQGSCGCNITISSARGLISRASSLKYSCWQTGGMSEQVNEIFFEGQATCLELLLPCMLGKFQIAQRSSHACPVSGLPESLGVEVVFQVTSPLLQGLVGGTTEMALGALLSLKTAESIPGRKGLSSFLLQGPSPGTHHS